MKVCTMCKVEKPITEFNKRGADHNYRPNGFCKKCQLIKWRGFNNRDKELVFNHYGNACACCGESEFAFLTIDHINDDGATHRKTFGGSIYRWLKLNNYPSNFQTLCFNCNFAKSRVVGGCPHQKKKFEQAGTIQLNFVDNKWLTVDH